MSGVFVTCGATGGLLGYILLIWARLVGIFVNYFLKKLSSWVSSHWTQISEKGPCPPPIGQAKRAPTH